MKTKELFAEIGEKHFKNFKCDKERRYAYNKILEVKEGNIRISSCSGDLKIFDGEDMEVVAYCLNPFGCVFITKTRKYMAWTLRANMLSKDVYNNLKRIDKMYNFECDGGWNEVINTIKDNNGWIAEGTEDKIKAVVMLGKISK